MQTAPSTQSDRLETPPHSPLTEYYERDRQDYVVDLFNKMFPAQAAGSTP